MKPFLTLSLTVLFCFPIALRGAETIFDINRPQSPRKPAPEWVKIIDQGKFDPRWKNYFTPEGVKLEIVADFPTVVNPVGMTFGDDGTLHVLEWRPDQGASFPETPVTFTYKDGSKRNVATMKKHVRDVVKILRDTRSQGFYDEAKVVLEDELPSSILIHDGWLYLSGRGTVRRYKQSKPGGPYDIRQVIAQGFCGFHHHQVSGMTIGNDGWLYITAGDDDNYVEGSDGSRATVLRTGAVFRCRPDGSQMQTFSLGYRNPYRDVAFDINFNIFHADNDNEDGSKFTGCRLMHVAEESDFGWRLRTGARCCAADFVRGAAFGELPGKLPPLLKTGRGAPAGLLIYNDTQFPESYRGLLYYPDVYRKLIRAYRVEPKGATFEIVEEFEFLKSDDPLFRPCQMVIGPDGAMYICDWRTNSGGAGQLWGDGKHGRIYRVSWGGNKEHPVLPLRPMDHWAKLLTLADGDLLQSLSSENFSDRQHSQCEVVRRGNSFRQPLLKLLQAIENPVRARLAALGALQSFWNEEVQGCFLKMLDDGEPSVRKLAAEGLALRGRRGDKDIHTVLLARLGDSEPAVRRVVALAIGKIAAPGAADCLINALKFDRGEDVFLRDGFVRSLERTGNAGVEKLLALAESGDEKDRNLAVDVFTSLRVRAGALALPSILDNPHLKPEQRARLLRSLGNFLLDPPLSLEPVVQYLLRHGEEPIEVKLAGLESLSLTRSLNGAHAVKLLMQFLDEPDQTLRLAVIKAIDDGGIAAAAPRLVKIFTAAPLSQAEQIACLKAFRVLKPPSVVPAILKLLREESNSTTQIREEALQTLAANDAIAAQTQARELLLHPESVTLQREAVQILGTELTGARWVAEQFLAKKMSRDLLPSICDNLRKFASKDKDIAKLLSDVMKGGLILSLDKASLENLHRLVAQKGNPKRGRFLFLERNKLACINCHRLEGTGGNVGPDLTRIWDTHTVEKIMESIIDPSKEIKEGYQMYFATTKAGQVFSGLKIAQSAEEVILRDANAKEIRLAAKDIEELTASKQSLMPENVVGQLTFDQFIDLVAFLKDRSAQEALHGMVLEYWVVGPFGNDEKAIYPPETAPNPTAAYPGLAKGEMVVWQPRQTDANGFLDLKGAFKPDSISAYALTFVNSPETQKASMWVGSDAKLKIWLNGKLVHDNSTHRGDPPVHEQVEVVLKAGWNPLLAKVVTANSTGAFSLRFKRAQGLRVDLKPEAK